MNLPRTIGVSLDVTPEDWLSFTVWRTTTLFNSDGQDMTSSRFHLAILGFTFTISALRYGNHLPDDTDFDINLDDTA